MRNQLLRLLMPLALFIGGVYAQQELEKTDTSPEENKNPEQLQAAE